MARERRPDPKLPPIFKFQGLGQIDSVALLTGEKTAQCKCVKLTYRSQKGDITCVNVPSVVPLPANPQKPAMQDRNKR